MMCGRSHLMQRVVSGESVRRFGVQRLQRRDEDVLDRLIAEMEAHDEGDQEREGGAQDAAAQLAQVLEQGHERTFRHTRLSSE